jgi:hypothetical protein
VTVSPLKRHRRLETGYRINVEGIVYYFHQAPSRESLSQTLRVYFSFWGEQDLKEHFEKDGLESALVQSIAIDETPVEFLSESHDDGGSPDDVEAISAEDEGMKGSSKIAIICIYFAAVVMIPAAIFVLMYVRRQRFQRIHKKKDESSRTDSDPTSGEGEVNSSLESKGEDDASNSIMSDLSQSIITAINKDALDTTPAGQADDD